MRPQQAYALGKAFRLGYVFALGIAYKRNNLAQDADNDDVIFRTSENGKHYAIDPNKGTIKGGLGKENNNVKISKPSYPKSGQDLTKINPSKTPQEYLKEASGNYDKAIKSYVTNELMGGHVARKLEINGKMQEAQIGFTGITRDEFKKFRDSLDKILTVLPYVTDVILTGDYSGRTPKVNHGKQVAFHTFMKTITINNRPMKMLVDVAETKHPHFYAYSVNRIGIKSFKDRENYFAKEKAEFEKRKIGQDATLLYSSQRARRHYRRHDASFRLVNDSIVQNDANVKFEVVGIRIL